MSLKSKLTEIIKRIEEVLSLSSSQVESKNDKLHDIYTDMIRTQDSNKELIFPEEELLKLFTEKEKTNYISTIRPLIQDNQMRNSEVRNFKIILQNVCERL